MNHQVLDPLGVRVEGLRLDRVDEAQVAEVVDLLGEHGVAVFPDQELGDTAFHHFLSRFGELTFTVGETPLEGFPDLNVITNVGRTTPPRSVFHVDTSYVAQPPAYTALRAVTIPQRGGETLFSNQYRAHDTLPAAVRESLRARTLLHVVSGLELGEDQETRAEHPVLATHPVSGRTSLYLSTPQRCVAVSGLGEEESGEMVQFLYDHSTRPDNVLRHVWSPGDVVMWDNRCVMHRADHADVVGDRVMHRGMVAS